MDLIRELQDRIAKISDDVSTLQSHLASLTRRLAAGEHVDDDQLQDVRHKLVLFRADFHRFQRHLYALMAELVHEHEI
ncbi:hypothetical protein EBT25_08490 [bacterium]|jgi:chromosome segregation ATPase|nr:hypothetical protein [bacterium]